MRALTAATLLEAWERGQGHGPTLRALALLAAAGPEAGWEELSALPLSERDRRLLELREGTLGRTIEGVARCPGCGEPLDVSLDTRSLRATPAIPKGLATPTGPAVKEKPAGAASPASVADPGRPAERESAKGSAPEREIAQVLGRGIEVRFRLPDSRDLLAAERCVEVAQARRLLAERCVVAARREGVAISPAELSDLDLEDLSVALAEADPGAELLLELRCPACGCEWGEALDVAGFVWAEMEIEAVRLLREVHLLARAYGWREPDVLALSPRRRRMYLEMARA